MKVQGDKVLRWYLLILMGGLFLQGVGSLIFRLTPALPARMPLLVRGAFGIDFWHALLHIAWGLVGLAVLSTSRTSRPLVYLALIFGGFYTALGVWGVLVHHPLGLELNLPENVFHLVAGPLALAIGWWSLRQMNQLRGTFFRWIASVTAVLILISLRGANAVAQPVPGYLAGAQIANLEANEAQVTLTLVKTNGEQIGAPVNDTIAANSSKTYFPLNNVVSTGCPSSASVGTAITAPNATRLIFPRPGCALVVNANRQLASVVNLISADLQRSGSYLYNGVGATTIYLPLLNKSNSGFDTQFSVINLGSGPANVQVSYSDGTSASASLPLNGSQVFSQTAETHFQRIFAGVITSNQPVFAAVTQDNGKVLFAYAGFTGGAVNPVFPIINANNAGYLTGLQIQNTGVQTTTVEVSYTPSEAGTACIETQSIAAGASKTFALAAFHSGANSTCIAKQPFVGAGRVTGNSTNQPLMGVGNQLLPGINGGTYSAFDPALATHRLLLPLIMDRNSGFFTGFSVQNISSLTTTVTCTFANSTYTVAAELQPDESVSDIQLQKLGVKYVGSAICTADNAAAKIVAVVNQLGSVLDVDQLLVYEGIPIQ